MLRAAALAYILIISLLVTLTLTGLLLLYRFQQNETDHFYYQEVAGDNMRSGIYSVLYGKGEKFGTFRGTLGEGGVDQWEVSSTAWGVYGLLFARGIHGQWRDSTAILFGMKPFGKWKASLFLHDKGRPLTLSGKTRLEGKFWVPSEGLKRGYVGGEGYLGTDIHYGQLHNSEGLSLAAEWDLLRETAQQMQKCHDGIFANGRLLKPGDSLTGKWEEEAIRIESAGALVLDRVKITGHVVVVAPEIIIRPDCQLHGVLLFANRILIEDEFEGALQAFATDTLELGQKVKLHYPSALVASNPEFDCNLSIGPESQVEGVVVNDPDLFSSRKKELSYTLIGTDAEVTGLVYAPYNLDLQGKVTGHVITRNFLLRTPSSVNENYLFNATLTTDGLGKGYATGLFLGDPEEYAPVEEVQ